MTSSGLKIFMEISRTGSKVIIKQGGTFTHTEADMLILQAYLTL
jgi:hypothetical protein